MDTRPEKERPHAHVIWGMHGGYFLTNHEQMVESLRRMERFLGEHPGLVYNMELEAYTLDRSGVALDFSRAHSGKSSVRLTKTPATKRTVALRQRFDVTPGTWYRASVRYQAAVKQGGFHIIFTAFDQDGRWLRHQDGARGVNSTADKWRELSVDTQVKEDTAELMIECLLYDDQAEGVAWVDDFTCAPLEKN